MKRELWEIVDNKTPFKMGGWIVREGKKLWAIADKEKWLGAKMVGYYSKFLTWKKEGHIKQLVLGQEL